MSARPGASGMIIDSQGEHYLIRRIADLPQRDRELLERYIHW